MHPTQRSARMRAHKPSQPCSHAVEGAAIRPPTLHPACAPCMRTAHLVNLGGRLDHHLLQALHHHAHARTVLQQAQPRSVLAITAAGATARHQQVRQLLVVQLQEGHLDGGVRVRVSQRVKNVLDGTRDDASLRAQHLAIVRVAWAALHGVRLACIPMSAWPHWSKRIGPERLAHAGAVPVEVRVLHGPMLLCMRFYEQAWGGHDGIIVPRAPGGR